MQYSYHVHSTHSDGRATIQELVNTASKIGLDEIGISDHFHIPKDGVLMRGDMNVDNLKNYVAEVLSYSSNIKPVVKLGLEVEFVNETLDQLKKIIKKYPFDYLIGSCHLIFNNVIDLSKDSLPANFTTDLMRQYWIIIKQMADAKIFDIVGHIDLTKKFDLKPTFDLSSEIEEALISIKNADMTVELNTSGWYWPCKEQYPSIEILKKCKKLDIPIIVTADVHRAEFLNRGFERAFLLLKEIGYKRVAFFKKRERFFLDF